MPAASTNIEKRVNVEMKNITIPRLMKDQTSEWLSQGQHSSLLGLSSEDKLAAPLRVRRRGRAMAFVGTNKHSVQRLTLEVLQQFVF